jgi:hypothetical protein
LYVQIRKAVEDDRFVVPGTRMNGAKNAAFLFGSWSLVCRMQYSNVKGLAANLIRPLWFEKNCLTELR